jgi:hypothetical protein
MPTGLRSRRRLGKAYTSVATGGKNGAEPPAKRAKLESVSPKKLRSRLHSHLPSEDDEEEEDEEMTSEEEETDHDRTMMADTTLSPLKPSNVANRLRRVRKTTRPLNQLNGKSKLRKLATSAEVTQYAYSSPRKRKRSSAEMDEDDMGDSGSVVSASSTDDYESIDGDETEPEYIDEGEYTQLCACSVLIRSLQTTTIYSTRLRPPHSNDFAKPSLSGYGKSPGCTSSLGLIVQIPGPREKRRRS